MRTPTCPKCIYAHNSWEDCIPLEGFETDIWLDPRFSSEVKDVIRHG